MSIYRDNDTLFIDGFDISKIADEYGTPLYIYSFNTMVDNIYKVKKVFEGLDYKISFAMKANGNIHILKYLKDYGLGADAVSIGEVLAAKRAGFNDNEIILNGNGKTEQEIKYAIENDLFAVNVDSKEELLRISKILEKYNSKALNIFLRVNPDIDPKTHPYISTGLKENKFGINIQDVDEIVEIIKRNPLIKLKGFHIHIGSQLLDYKPYYDAIEILCALYDRYSELNLEYFNIGGGWGIDYHHNNKLFPVDDYKENIIPLLKRINKKIIIEFGRYIIGNSAVIVSNVLYIKKTAYKNFLVLDAGMNDLLRPSLYQAYHHVEPVIIRTSKKDIFDIVGPICESGDVFHKNYEINSPEIGDYIVFYDVGAYGFSMASNYNMRLRPAEVLIKDNKVELIRKRESFDEIFNY